MNRLPTRPYRVLTFVTFHRTNAVVYLYTGQAQIDTAKAAIELRMSTHDLRNDLKWLREKGYLTELLLERGKATVKLLPPSNSLFSKGAL
jgi:hypothetical protein